jgi:hypothetical protein
MDIATSLIRPDIDRCPCCGLLAELGYRSERIKLECLSTADSDGKLIDFVRNWYCLNCGCTWRHGQFAGAGVKGDSQTRDAGQRQAQHPVPAVPRCTGSRGRSPL